MVVLGFTSKAKVLPLGGTMNTMATGGGRVNHRLGIFQNMKRGRNDGVLKLRLSGEEGRLGIW